MFAIMTDRPASNVPESVRHLLAGAVDYAGLFPPSAVSMAEAIGNYAAYRTSGNAWMLGRFVVSAARLSEFRETLVDLELDEGAGWHLAGVATEDHEASVKTIHLFNREFGPDIVCDTVEVKVSAPFEIEVLSRRLPQNLTVYFELDPKGDLAGMLSAVASFGHRAKIRTGGIVPEAFPQTADIVRFVEACIAADVPFKATAGLHHPIRCFRPLTYESDGPKGTMNGFLNLFVMTGFALDAYRSSLLEDVMHEEAAEAFEFTGSEIAWRKDYALNLAKINNLRTRGIHAFGSCSFEEPVADLRMLGVL
ncbi:MAG: hypothetical protein HS105_03530 [Chloracidobacterium sp.]|nr:hypothetical protein [Chloracidobacterium sp.]MCO5333196.1 hypothetical protein [Pyrinomonadaceae bacterium]